MNARQIRQSFLDYFAQNGHRIVPSSSLVPSDDPTLLFTNAGMNQFKDLFLGREKRDYVRATTSQKCMRVSGKHNDLDNVGPSLRHHTFFEMLGNFSFGDYFKEQAIAFAWTVLTDVWRLPADRLRASIFNGEGGIPRDDEAYKIWRQYLPADRIDELGQADNFWQMGETGPCGRCSEIHFDRRDAANVPESDRLIEVWNNVFMEFNRRDGGVLEPLPAPSIDTGMGLERITAVIQGRFSNYDTDLFEPILTAIAARTGTRYGAHPQSDVSMRLVADHIRATVFLIDDGVRPSKEWRGYVLRKIMRRAMRHGKRLRGADPSEPLLHQLVDTVVDEMGEAYPALTENRARIRQAVLAEEEQFNDVLNQGLPRLEKALTLAAAQNRVLAGAEAFKLHDTFGIDMDFIEDIASSQGISIDRAGYDTAMEAQRERARAGSSFEAKKATAFTFSSDAERARIEGVPDRFEGYESTTLSAEVVALFDENRAQITELPENTVGYVVTDNSPFYLEAGGQVSDTGTIETAHGLARVQGVARVSPGGPRAHKVLVERGSLRPQATVTLDVDGSRRDAIRRNHTATHLVHAALRQVLGAHVKQAGSLVAPERLRFDFVQPAPIAADDLARIERIVNQHVLANLSVQTEVRATSDAIASGAMALFGEKYGDTVRVVTVPGVSVELCGGTHCRATGDIGLFVMTSEGGVAAGVRRVEAVTGTGAYEHYRLVQNRLDRVLRAVNAGSDQAPEVIERLQADVKRLTRELQEAKVQAAMGGGAAASADDAVLIDGATLIARQLSGLDRAALRTLADSLKDKLGSGVIVLASDADGKVALVVAVTRDLTSRVQAGQIVRQIAPIVGGSGGGRPDFAEAGGKDPGKIADLLKESRSVVAQMLGTVGG